MTIVATHFALVLGAWRLRVRIDIDEPRESEMDGDDLSRTHLRAREKDSSAFARVTRQA